MQELLGDHTKPCGVFVIKRASPPSNVSLIAHQMSRELMLEAATISRTYTGSSYDTFYLALGRRDALPVITADERLLNAAKGKEFDVRNVQRL